MTEPNISQKYTVSTIYDNFKLYIGKSFLNGQLLDYQKILLNRLPIYLNVKDKVVLEVGAEDANTLHALEKQGMRYGIGINNWLWEYEEENVFRVTDHIILGHGDINSLPIEDNSFDVIISVAAFEHILNLEKALQEMYRLLKPGGVIFTMFAPIWSNPFVGHHLWFENKGNGYRFNEEDSYRHLIKPGEHLLYDKAEMKNILEQRCDSQLAEQLIYELYDTYVINRYTYADYRRFIANSGFKIISFKKYWETLVDQALLEKLQQKHGCLIDFCYAGLELLLQKP